MRITIDYTSAVRQRAGVGRYTRNLVAALADLDHTNSYTLFCAGGARTAAWPSNFKVRTTQVPERLLPQAGTSSGCRIPAERIAGQADIFHSPDFTLPPFIRRRRRNGPRFVISEAAPSAPTPGFTTISPTRAPVGRPCCPRTCRLREHAA